MIQRLTALAARAAAVHPFNLLARRAVARLPFPVRVRERFDASPRPAYLCGLLKGAEQALREGVREICAIEFGVAGGNGLLALQEEARRVERELGIAIHVAGFDTGAGLPELCGDHRDQPDDWRPADYPMDEARLRPRLHARTRLILGPVAETVEAFVETGPPAPVAFVSFDLDLYSSTRDALRLFSHPRRRMLRHVPCYFDDIAFFTSHFRAGELLAVDEFNRACDEVVIDRWRGVERDRPFPHADWLPRMFVAHHLPAIAAAAAARPPLRHCDLR